MSELRHKIARIMYLTTWPIWYIIFRFFLHYKIEYANESVKDVREGPLMVVANHVTWLDPFMVGVALPNKSSIFPIRWITKNSLFREPVVGQAIWLYGSIPVVKGKGLQKNLEVPLNILRAGRVVGIFPQGRIWKGGRPRKGRVGAAYLAAHSDPLIVPARIKGIRQTGFRKFILRRERVTIKLGEPFKLPKELQHNPVDLQEAADYIWSKVREL